MMVGVVNGAETSVPYRPGGYQAGNLASKAFIISLERETA